MIIKLKWIRAEQERLAAFAAFALFSFHLFPVWRPVSTFLAVLFLLNGTFAPMRRYKLDLGAACKWITSAWQWNPRTENRSQSFISQPDFIWQPLHTRNSSASSLEDQENLNPRQKWGEKNNSANKFLVIIHRKAFQHFTQTVLAWMTSKIHIYIFSTTFSSISMFPSFLSHLQHPTQPLNNLNVFPSSPSALSHCLFFSTCSPPPISPLIFSSLFQCTAPPTITSWLYFTSQTRPLTPWLAQSSHTARLLSTASSRAGKV